MQIILPYKKNLREDIKLYKEFAYGFTSTIYRKDKYVIKEIYLEDILEKSNKLNELLLNIYFKEHPRYEKYTVPFISYDTYDKILLLKFKYMGSSLEENILDFSPDDLGKIDKNVKYALTILNKKVSHQDLHIANIFVDPITLNVKIGDWGKGIFETDIFNKDYLFYRKSFEKSLKLGLFKQFYTKQDLTDMINTKLLQNKIEKEMNYIKLKFPHKPKYFYPKLKEYVKQRIFNSLLENTNEYKSF